MTLEYVCLSIIEAFFKGCTPLIHLSPPWHLAPYFNDHFVLDIDCEQTSLIFYEVKNRGMETEQKYYNHTRKKIPITKSEQGSYVIVANHRVFKHTHSCRRLLLLPFLLSYSQMWHVHCSRLLHTTFQFLSHLSLSLLACLLYLNSSPFRTSSLSSMFMIGETLSTLIFPILLHHIVALHWTSEESP